MDALDQRLILLREHLHKMDSEWAQARMPVIDEITRLEKLRPPAPTPVPEPEG